MQSIYLSDRPKEAFARGFWKGLAAPVMVFGQFTEPTSVEVKTINYHPKSDLDALAGDWIAIGKDFKKL